MRLSSVAWSAAGLAAPMLVALMAIPTLLARLGPERFGLLSLAWALTSISGLFDLGVGRATTRLIAAQLGRSEFDRPRAVLAAAVRIAGRAGCGGAVLLATAAMFGLHQAVRLDHVLSDEVRAALMLLALAIPLQTLTATYRGVSEAYQRFRGISLTRMLLGIANFALPMLVALVTPRLEALVATLIVARLLACMAFRHLALAALPMVPMGPTSPPLSDDERKQLLSAGGWFTVSAVVSPVLAEADRFFIGAMLSAAAVTTYAIPFDIITQLMMVVTSVSTVAFPSMAFQIGRDQGAARRMLNRWLGAVTVTMAVICLLVAWVLPDALRWWVGSALPAEATTVGRLLCLGVWINSSGAMYFAWLHGQGRFRATAITHLLELPPYVALLMYLLHEFGVSGAAMAWVARVLIDSLALWWLASRSGHRDQT